MKIEFRCESCDSLLRMAPRFAGQAVDCPACHTLQWVPHESQRQVVSVPAPEAAPPTPPPTRKPRPQPRRVSAGQPQDRSCPECQAHVTSQDTACHACGIALDPESDWQPTTTSIQAIVQDAWAIYVDKLWLLAGAALIEGFVGVIGLVLTMVPLLLVMSILVPIVDPSLVIMAVFGMMGLGLIVVRNVMVAGFCRFHLKVARGERVSIFDAVQIEWRRGGVSILPTMYGFLLLTGLAILVIPGVVIFLVMWPYCWIWADGKTNGRDLNAFPLANDLTANNLRVSLALLGLGVALFFVSPLAFPFSHSLKGVLQAVAYLHMSGQPVSGRRRPVV